MLGVRFSGVRDDAASYVKAKFLAAGVEEAEISDAASGDDGAIVLGDFDSLSIARDAMIEIRARRRCATMTVDEMLPLIEGECVEEDYFTILDAPFEELDRGTAVLRRTTNLGVAHIFFPDFSINPANELVYTGLPEALLDPALLASPPPQSGFKLGGMDPVSLLTQAGMMLAKALLSKLGSETGTWIFKEVFGAGVPDYFSEVYAEMRKIVRDELDARDIDLISAKLTGLLEWQHLIYAPKNPRAATGREREKLFDAIEEQLRSMEAAIALLRHDRWRKAGMTVFMTAGGMYFALCQEACFMDFSTDDPRKSSYFKTIQLTAPVFADSLERTFRDLLRARIDTVFLEKGTKNIRIGGKSYMTQTYRWNDPVKGTKGQVHAVRKTDKKTVEGKPFEEATADLEKYRRTLPASFAADMGQPEEVAGKWRMLIDQPLPLPA